MSFDYDGVMIDYLGLLDESIRLVARRLALGVTLWI